MDDTDVTSALKEAIGSVLEEARKVPPVQTQNPTQHVVLHQAEAPKPAPWHAWACVTACLVMFVITTVTSILFLDLSRKYDRMQDYYNIILQHAPDLKTIIDKEKKDA